MNELGSCIIITKHNTGVTRCQKSGRWKVAITNILKFLELQESIICVGSGILEEKEDRSMGLLKAGTL